MQSLTVALTLLATAASAQQELSTPSYWDRCYGAGYQAQPNYFFVGSYYGTPAPTPTPPLGGASSAGASPALSMPSGGGAGAGYALLVAAVVAVVALPVIVYAVDKDPPPRVLRRFYCPSFSFDGWGGAEGGLGGSGPNPGTSQWSGIAAARIRMGVSHFGSDIQFDASPSGVGSFSIHGLIRPTPKEHIEVGIALGYKRAYQFGSMREGFEIGLPQTYTLWRKEGRELQIEVRPGVFITTNKTVDVSVDTAVLIPVLEILSIRLGARAFSYDLQPQFGFSGGLSLRL